jgi:hypothetical protein
VKYAKKLKWLATQHRARVGNMEVTLHREGPEDTWRLSTDNGLYINRDTHTQNLNTAKAEALHWVRKKRQPIIDELRGLG